MKKRNTKFIEARKTMKRFLKGKGLRDAYRANIAMLIYDNRDKEGRLNSVRCNEVAEKLINLIW